MIESVKKKEKTTHFGPSWAIHRPSGGLREPPGKSGSSWTLTVILQVDSGIAPLGPKSTLNRIFKGPAPRNPVSTSIWIEGCPDSFLSCRCALRMQREDSQRDQTG